MFGPDKDAENAMRDEELGTWLNGLPNATASSPHLNLHHDHVTIGSPVRRVSSLTPDSSSPSGSFSSNGFRFSGDASPCSASFLERKQHQMPNDHYSTRLCLDSDSSVFHYMGMGKKNISDEKWVDDVGLRLCDDFSAMNMNGTDSKTRGYEMKRNSYTCSLDPYQRICNEVQGMGISSSTWGFSPSFVCDMKWAMPASGKGYTFGTPMEYSLAHDHSGALYSGSGWSNSQMYHLKDHGKKQGSSSCDAELQFQKPSFASPYHRDRFMCSRPFGMDYDVGRSVKNPLSFSQTMHPKLALNLDHSPSHYCFPTKESNNEIPHCISPRRGGSDPEVFKCDNSFIIQGKDVKYCFDNGCNSLKGCKENSHNDVAIQFMGKKVPKHISHAPICENNSALASDMPHPLLSNYCSLAEVQVYICYLAKDQNGCRFLQRMVDEGTSEDMRMVFKGIIDNVVELMMDPFGNYLVQKLLDVCREDQRLQIVLMLTREPGVLVKTSLNTHGTRVVQKLIETLKSRKQISLVMSAIQPGFLDLIKDLNGNHVIQRCLQCLSCQDNEFIFDAAAKFCKNIATHRHGCCVLQRCIDHSVGKYQDKLVTEICRHGLDLAQDPFGNYVVQYIIELEIPTASTKLIAQFKGNYVNLSTQKFSSHVVEKCLKHVGESRSTIVRELLSAPHFEQFLQDEFANYVIQTALQVTKGSLHAALVDEVRHHKDLRNSPYCKRIFSGSLLKK